MSDPDFKPHFNLPDWGQKSPKTRIQDEEDKENRTPIMESDSMDKNVGKESIATESVGTPGRKESVATKLGWSTTFTMDEDKRASLVFQALRRESVAVEQRKESMAIEASIEAQRKESIAIEASVEAKRKKTVTFLSPKSNSDSKKSRGFDSQSQGLSEPGSPVGNGITTQALRSKNDSDKDLSDQAQRSLSIAGPDFDVRREPATFGRRPSQADILRREATRQDRRPSYADTLFERGRLPGIVDEEEEEARRPGDKDAAGNKIHHQGVWARMLHWELDAANAEGKDERRHSRVSDGSIEGYDNHGRRKSSYSGGAGRQERRESGYSSAGSRHERKRSEYERI